MEGISGGDEAAGLACTKSIAVYSLKAQAIGCLLGLALGAVLAGNAEEQEMSDSRRITTATYSISDDRQPTFLELLRGAEATMREIGLITDRPVIRMRSLADPRFLVEIFEWSDAGAFERAQKDPRILEWWGKFEPTWEAGGFGLSELPEAAQPWAQFAPVD